MQTIHEYQGFAVDFKELSQLLNFIDQDKKVLLDSSGFGDNKVRGLKDYLKDFALVDEGKSISALGDMVRANDRKLVDDFSRWLCLYHWSNKSSNPALFYVINSIDDNQKTGNILDLFKKWANENDVQTNYKKNYSAGLLTKSVNALTDPDAFQNLNLFVIYEDRLYRAEPYNVHPLLIAYILYDNSRGRHSISLAELLIEPGNIGKFFGYDMAKLDRGLNDLENIGLVKRVQHANLNMVELLYNGSPLAFVKQYYEEN